MLPKKKAFIGKWIFHPSKPYDLYDEDGSEVDRYAVAVSAKGAAVIYYWTESPERVSGKRFRIFSSLEDAATDSDLRPAAIEAIEKLGVPVEELDI